MNCWNSITRNRYWRKTGKHPAPGCRWPGTFGYVAICARYGHPPVNATEKLPWHNGAVRTSQLCSRNTEPFLSMSPKCLWRTCDLPSPHVSVLSQDGLLAVAGRRGSEVPRSVWLSEPIVLVLCCSQDLLWILEIIGTNIATWPMGRVWLFSRWLGKGKSDSCLCGCALRMLSLTWGPLSLEKHALPLHFCNPGDCLNHDGPL